MLENKKILIISPDRWRKLHVSKHHYAIELASRNNEVYFLNPMEPGVPTREISKVDGFKNIFSIDFNFTKRGERFYPNFLLRVIEYIQIKAFLKFLKIKIDVVWCFSDFSIKSLDYINANIVIFHPVDMMMSGGIYQAKHSDIIFSVADNILCNYSSLGKPAYIVNHGLSNSYKTLAISNLRNNEIVNYKPGTTIKVGYVGNMLRMDIDHKIFLKIIEKLPEIEFNLWGPFEFKDVGLEYDVKDAVVQFVNKLKNMNNVKLHGLVDSYELGRFIQDMDAFFICYDAKKEINQCSNNHKIIEYFSTGKCVVSNYISSYDNQREMVIMPMDHNNGSLPDLMEMVTRNLEQYNSNDAMKSRIEFSLDNTYQKNVDRIDCLLTKHFT